MTNLINILASHPKPMSTNILTFNEKEDQDYDSGTSILLIVFYCKARY